MTEYAIFPTSASVCSLERLVIRLNAYAYVFRQEHDLRWACTALGRQLQQWISLHRLTPLEAVYLYIFPFVKLRYYPLCSYDVDTMMRYITEKIDILEVAFDGAIRLVSSSPSSSCEVTPAAPSWWFRLRSWMQQRNNTGPWDYSAWRNK